MIPVTAHGRKGGYLGLRGGEVHDRFGRAIRVLRVSVTDRCDLRCAYCAPVGSLLPCAALARREALSPDDIGAVVEAAVGLGIDRVRLTGGEPLVRADIVKIVERLARTRGLARLSLTTNGQRLARLAGPLARAGLGCANVSVDSLDEDRFAAIRRGGSLRLALEGIDATLAAGIAVKVNAVVLRGLNDQDIVPLALLARERPLHVRFLEYMPSGAWRSGNPDLARFVPGAEVVARIREQLGPLEERARVDGDGPAIYYSVAGWRGSLGVITAVSHPFCDRCNRLRVLADGRLRPCLFAEEAIDLKPAIRAGRAAIEEALRIAVRAKPESGAPARSFPLRLTGG